MNWRAYWSELVPITDVKITKLGESNPSLYFTSDIGQVKLRPLDGAGVIEFSGNTLAGNLPGHSILVITLFEVLSALLDLEYNSPALFLWKHTVRLHLKRKQRHSLTYHDS
jgi:hypothetical protein